MADQKISQLTELTSPSGSDVLPIVNNSETKKITVSNLLSSINESFATTGSNTFVGDETISGSLIVTHDVVIGDGEISISDPEKLVVVSSGSYNISYFEGDSDTYSQIKIKNNSANSGASSDLVLEADNGTEENHYINLGINSSGWEFQTASIGFQNDGYLYNVGQDLYIGSMNPSSPQHGTVRLFSFGNWNDASINLLGGNKIGFNTGSVDFGYKFQFSGSVKLQNSLLIGSGSFHNDNPEILHVENSGSFNIVHLEGNNDTYLQLNIKNTSSSAGSSTDFVATADNGSEEMHYVNMGINSSNYNEPGIVGYSNDAYLINKGRDLYIGSLDGPDSGHTHVHLFASNSWENPEINILSAHKVGFNTGSVVDGYNFEFSGSAKFNNDVKVDGYIQGSGSVFLQPDTNDSRYLEIYNTAPSDIHIRGNASLTYFGDDTNYVMIDSINETITINTTSGTTMNGFVVLANVSSSLDFANDAAAEAGGVPLGGLYRNGNFVMIRMS